MKVEDVIGFRVAAAQDVVRRLIERAERAHRHGLEPFHKVFTGVAPLDDQIESWWGCITLTGEAGTGKTALALRFAAKTAEAGGTVLWFCAAGLSEGAALRLLTSRARVLQRRVFVVRDLVADDWQALKQAGDEVGRWPLLFADVHGASPDDLRLLCGAVVKEAREGGPRVELIVLDSMSTPGRTTLRALEMLADDLGTPVFVLFSGEVDPEQCLARSPLRPGTLALKLRWAPAKDSVALEVRRVGEGLEFTALLRPVPEFRTLEYEGSPP